MSRKCGCLSDYGYPHCSQCGACLGAVGSRLKICDGCQVDNAATELETALDSCQTEEERHAVLLFLER